MSGSEAAPFDWNGYLRLIEVAQLGLYIHAAATAVCIYDHITTLDLEIELIWKRKISLVQILYFVNRYVGEAVLIHGSAYQIWLKGEAFVQACKIGAFTQMVLSMVAVWCSQSILINRVWCMYSRSTTVILLLLVAFAAEIASSLAVIVMNRNLVSLAIPLTQTVSSCFPTGLSSWFWIFWIGIVVFDVLIFGLALWKGLRHYIDTRQLRAHQQADIQKDGAFSRMTFSWINTGGDFINVLIRDSIVFPFLSLVTCLLNLVAWFGVLPDGWLQISLILSAAASPILGCRLILNLRELYYEPFAEEVRPRMASRKQKLFPHGEENFTGPSYTEERRSIELPVFAHPSASIQAEYRSPP